MKRHVFLMLLGIAAAFVLSGAVPARGDPGDPAGWFLRVDPRGRAFLAWTPMADGPRLIMFGCLRDAETFTAMSAAVGDRDEVRPARLRVVNGSSVFEIDGEITMYPHIQRSAFIADLDADDTGMRAIAERLLPVLEAPGDLVLWAGPIGGEIARSTIPREGLDRLLPRFGDVCFR